MSAYSDARSYGFVARLEHGNSEAVQETLCNSQRTISGQLSGLLIFVEMKATNYNKDREAIFGVLVMVACGLGALIVLFVKLYCM